MRVKFYEKQIHIWFTFGEKLRSHWTWIRIRIMNLYPHTMGIRNTAGALLTKSDWTWILFFSASTRLSNSLFHAWYTSSATRFTSESCASWE
jgi:hypothetical protein